MRAPTVSPKWNNWVVTISWYHPALKHTQRGKDSKFLYLRFYENHRRGRCNKDITCCPYNLVTNRVMKRAWKNLILKLNKEKIISVPNLWAKWKPWIAKLCSSVRNHDNRWKGQDNADGNNQANDATKEDVFLTEESGSQHYQLFLFNFWFCCLVSSFLERHSYQSTCYNIRK